MGDKQQRITASKEDILIVCGIELGGSTATIIVLYGSANDFRVVDTGIAKLEINDSESTQDVVSFYDSFHSFIKNNNVEKIGIKKHKPDD